MPMQHDFSSATSTNVSVGATTTVALAANEARRYAVLVNDSDEDIYISLGAAAVLNKGIRLNAYGGTLNISGDRPFRGAINAICTSGSKNLAILHA